MKSCFLETAWQILIINESNTNIYKKMTIKYVKEYTNELAFNY